MAFLGIISALGKGAKQALPLIRSGVRQGIGADTLFQSLRTKFGGLLRREVRVIARAERAILSSASDLRFLNFDKIPDPRRLPPALTKIRRQFSFKVRMQGTNPATGESVQSFLTVTTDDLMARQDIEGVAQDFVDTDRSRYEVVFEEFTLFEGVKAGPAGTLG